MDDIDFFSQLSYGVGGISTNLREKCVEFVGYSFWVFSVDLKLTIPLVPACVQPIIQPSRKKSGYSLFSLRIEMKDFLPNKDN